jgi:hypothetical protein
MAWTIDGGTISAGQSVRWWFSFSGWPGIEVIRARPVATSSGGLSIRAPATLSVSDLAIGNDAFGNYTYWITVRHTAGWSPVHYELVGDRA